jgi:hypothetical protein
MPKAESKRNLGCALASTTPRAGSPLEDQDQGQPRLFWISAFPPKNKGLFWITLLIKNACL